MQIVLSTEILFRHVLHNLQSLARGQQWQW